MSEPETPASSKDTIRLSFNTGLVSLYSLPDAGESIILRVTSLEDGDPRDGEKYIVEFRHSETGEVQEVLEEDSSRLFDPQSIRRVMDDLAENYLQSIAEEWEAYVDKSGR